VRYSINMQRLLFDLATTTEQLHPVVVQRLRSEKHIARIAKYARQHKVATSVLRILREYNDEALIPEGLTKYVMKLGSLQHFYREELSDLIVSGIIPPQSVLILKGLSVQRWYTNQRHRESTDIDLVTEREEDFWGICRWLSDRGYNSPTMGVAYVKPHRSHSRYIFIYAKECLEARQQGYFEILHLAASITFRKFFDLEPIIVRARNAANAYAAQSGDLDGDYFLYPTREDCLLTLLVETSERSLVVRDAIDFGMLLGDTSDSDLTEYGWRMLCARIDEEALDTQFLRLAHYYCQLSRRPLPPLVKKTYRRWARRNPHWRFVTRSTTLGHVVPYMLRHHGTRKAAHEAILTILENIADKPWLRKLQTHSRWLDVEYQDNEQKEAMIYLLKLSECQRGPVEWRAGQNNELLLRTPAGVFFSTRKVEFTEEALEQILDNLPADWGNPLTSGAGSLL